MEDFDAIPITDEKKPKVGIVGEILVKFAPAANNHLVELLESEGAEAVVPDLLDFMFYCFYNQLYKAEHLGTSKNPHSWQSLESRAWNGCVPPQQKLLRNRSISTRLQNL